MQRLPTTKRTVVAKMHDDEKDEKKVLARPPMAWGYLEIDRGQSQGEEDCNETPGRFVRNAWLTPRTHSKPLKMETTHKLVRASSRRSIWYVKAAMIIAPMQPKAVEADDSQLVFDFLH